MTRLSIAIAKVGKVAGLQGVCKTLPRYKTSKLIHGKVFSSSPHKMVYFIIKDSDTKPIQQSFYQMQTTITCYKHNEHGT